MNGFTNMTAQGPSEDSFVRGFGLQSLERIEMRGWQCPCVLRNVASGWLVCLPGKLTFWIPIGGNGGHSTAHKEPESGYRNQKA